MIEAGGPAPSERARVLAASAWRFRWQVELEAEDRFARLAGRLAELGAAAPLVELARRASRDEQRHAALCAEMASEYGAPVPAAGALPAAEIAPAGLALRGRVLYEVVAACCVAETGSMAVLTTLLASAREPRLRRVLRELAADEVGHARLGWAHLAGEHREGATAFLGPWLPAMLQGSIAEDLFRPASPDREDPALLDLGVLPHGQQREVFTGTLEEVVLPGLERCGVDTAPARAWLAERRAELASARPDRERGS